LAFKSCNFFLCNAACWIDSNCDLGYRYQREEAKIQAWVNLQNAKAEAQSRKLEVFSYAFGYLFVSSSFLFFS
jgi:hypothetical protein